MEKVVAWSRAAISPAWFELLRAPGRQVFPVVNPVCLVVAHGQDADRPSSLLPMSSGLMSSDKMQPKVATTA